MEAIKSNTKMTPYYYVGTTIQVSPDEFIKLACEALGITPDILRLKSRKGELVFIRAAIIRRLMELYDNLTLKKMGKLINRDHSTVLYYRDRMPSSPEYENNYKKLLTLVY